MPKPGSAAPAPSLAVLSETVDLLGVVVAKMSEKLDQHGETLAVVRKISLESRDAAQAARTQTDPKRYATHIGEEVYDAIGQSLDRQEEQTLQRLRDELDKAGRWKKRTPFIALFGLALLLGLSIALPRFMAGNGVVCAVLGGQWLRGPETGKQACVFYAK